MRKPNTTPKTCACGRESCGKPVIGKVGHKKYATPECARYINNKKEAERRAKIHAARVAEGYTFKPAGKPGGAEPIHKAQQYCISCGRYTHHIARGGISTCGCGRTRLAP